MLEITRSRAAMLLVAAGAGLAAIAGFLGVLAFATLSLTAPTRYTDLLHTASWLIFAGWLVVLCAAMAVSGRLVADRNLPAAAEAGAVALGVLLAAVGQLIAAASSFSQTSSDVVQAISTGVWALLALVVAARRSFGGPPRTRSAATPDRPTPPEYATPPDHPAPPDQETWLWLTAGAALILLAVGSGLGYGTASQGASIASAVLTAAGALVLAVVVATARSAGLLDSRAVSRVLLALALLACYGIAGPVVAGAEFGFPGPRRPPPRDGDRARSPAVVLRRFRRGRPAAAARVAGAGRLALPGTELRRGTSVLAAGRRYARAILHAVR